MSIEQRTPGVAGRLTDKVVLITGGAQGIGAAIARRVTAEGGRVSLADRTPAVRAVADELGGVAFVGDVTADGAPESAVAGATERFGRLDGLVNAAAIQRNGSGETFADEDWDATIAVNLTAPSRWIRAAVPALLPRGGSIVNIGSITSTHATPDSLAYVASKHGLIGVTRSVAVDLGRRGIRCNAICPGTINTEFLADYARRNPEKAARLVEQNFAGRLGEPEEIAACCAFLLADESGFVNGASFPVDGARSVAS